MQPKAFHSVVTAREQGIGNGAGGAAGAAALSGRKTAAGGEHRGPADPGSRKADGDHAALAHLALHRHGATVHFGQGIGYRQAEAGAVMASGVGTLDRKSTRLNSSH